MRRRRQRITISIAVPDAIRESEQNVVKARATLARLMEVVAKRVFVSQEFQVRRIAVQDVVELHRSRAFTGRKKTGRWRS